MHINEFKAYKVVSRQIAGISVAAVAMANGINSDLLRRWVREAESRADFSSPAMLRGCVKTFFHALFGGRQPLGMP